jgi:hypothetical protein
MNKNERSAASAEELVNLTKDTNVQRIVVHGDLIKVPSIRLAPGQFLRGEHERSSVTFADGVDGLQLSSDNRVHNISLNVAPDNRAIFNDTSVASLGRIELRDVTTIGCVQILARDKVRGGHVDVNGLDIIAADARGEKERPHGYGVYVLNGAFTLWNMQQETGVVISADLVGLSVGRDGAPVRGSGIFVSGGGDKAGRLNVRRLETDADYSDGGIAPGTPDQITAASSRSMALMSMSCATGARS